MDKFIHFLKATWDRKPYMSEADRRKQWERDTSEYMVHAFEDVTARLERIEVDIREMKGV